MGRSLLRTWLFGIARRQAHNTLRRKGVPLAEETETAATSPGPEDEVLIRTCKSFWARLGRDQRFAKVRPLVYKLRVWPP